MNFQYLPPSLPQQPTEVPSDSRKNQYPSYTNFPIQQGYPILPPPQPLPQQHNFIYAPPSLNNHQTEIQYAPKQNQYTPFNSFPPEQRYPILPPIQPIPQQQFFYIPQAQYPQYVIPGQYIEQPKNVPFDEYQNSKENNNDNGERKLITRIVKLEKELANGFYRCYLFYLYLSLMATVIIIPSCYWASCGFDDSYYDDDFCGKFPSFEVLSIGVLLNFIGRTLAILGIKEKSVGCTGLGLTGGLFFYLMILISGEYNPIMVVLMGFCDFYLLFCYRLILCERKKLLKKFNLLPLNRMI